MKQQLSYPSLQLRFLTLQRPPPDMSFAAFKGELVSCQRLNFGDVGKKLTLLLLQIERAREFVTGSGRCRELISENMNDFIVDGSVSRHFRRESCVQVEETADFILHLDRPFSSIAIV